MPGEQPSNFMQAYSGAGEILAQKSNRLKLIEALLFCVTVFIFGILAQTVCAEIASLPSLQTSLRKPLQVVGEALFWCIQLLVTAPLVLGTVQMAQRMSNGNDVFLPDLFHPFAGGKAYFRSLVILAPFYWKAALFWGAPALLFELLNRFFGKSFLLSLLEGVVLTVCFAAWLLLALRGFFRLSFLLSRGMSLRAARKATGKIAGKSFCEGCKWWLRFFPYLLLGLLTVGILLIADVIPRMMISYFQYTGRMTDYAFSSEEPNHE